MPYPAYEQEDAVDPRNTFQGQVMAEFVNLFEVNARIQDSLDNMRHQHDRVEELLLEIRQSVAVAAPRARKSVRLDGPPSVVDERPRMSGMRPTTSSTAVLVESCIHSADGIESTFGNSEGFVCPALPVNWPACLQPKLEFAKTAEIRRINSAGSMCFFYDEDGPQSSPIIVNQPVRWKFQAMDPLSMFYMAYAVLSLLVLLFDLTVLPFILAWDLEVDVIQLLVPTVFWTVDLFLNFGVGFYREDHLVIELRASAKHYVMTWFLLDIALVSTDWASWLTGMEEAASGVKVLRFTKMGRGFRLLGMLRVVRVARTLERIAEIHLSHVSRLMFHVCANFMATMWCAHILACIWFSVGASAATDTGAHWLGSADLNVNGEIVRVLDTPKMYQYTVALHWAVGQIALGAIDTVPQNSAERLIWVMATLVGFIFGSTLVSSLSAAMINFQMSKKDRVTKIRAVRRYLMENNIPSRISTLVTRQVQQRLARPDALKEADVPALATLSTSLRAELRLQIAAPHLSTSSIFNLWLYLDKTSIERVTLDCIHFFSMRQSDVLFTAGQTASNTYFLRHGEMEYMQDPLSFTSASVVTHVGFTKVVNETWISEAALWCDWMHVGRMEACSDCELLQIDAQELGKCLSGNLLLYTIAAEYGKQYLKRIVEAKPPHSGYPTDLRVPNVNYADLVGSMASELRVLISIAAINRMARNVFISPFMKRRLRGEVLEGKSFIVANPDGSLLRTVSIVVLRCERSDGRVFAQIGKWSGVSMQTSCELPALKQQWAETPETAMERMLETKLLIFSKRLTHREKTEQTSERPSPDSGIMTRYKRAMFVATLTDEGIPLSAPFAALCGVGKESNRERFSHRRTASNLGVGVGKISSGVSVFARMASRDFSVTSPTKAAATSPYRRYPVFVVHDGDGSRAHLYSWLEPGEVELFQTPAGEALLLDWLQALRVPEQGSVPDFDISEIAWSSGRGVTPTDAEAHASSTLQHDEEGFAAPDERIADTKPPKMFPGRQWRASAGVGTWRSDGSMQSMGSLGPNVL